MRAIEHPVALHSLTMRYVNSQHAHTKPSPIRPLIAIFCLLEMLRPHTTNIGINVKMKSLRIDTTVDVSLGTRFWGTKPTALHPVLVHHHCSRPTVPIHDRIIPLGFKWPATGHKDDEAGEVDTHD